MDSQAATCTNRDGGAVRFLHVAQPLNHAYRTGAHDGDAAQVRICNLIYELAVFSTLSGFCFDQWFDYVLFTYYSKM